MRQPNEPPEDCRCAYTSGRGCSNSIAY